MTQIELYPRPSLPPAKESRAAGDVYQTPAWVADALVDRFYQTIGVDDFVVEPTCGEGFFLQAVPMHVPAIGVEIDAQLAANARRRTGRDVIHGDVLSIELPRQPTLLIGNPPFSGAFVDALLDRAYTWLPDGGGVGFILPSFLIDRMTRVARERRRWAIHRDALPRGLFLRLKYQVAFVRFTKTRDRVLVGFALFDEAYAMREIVRRSREILDRGAGPVWRTVVLDALQDLGGEATLPQLYGAIERRRPTRNPFWREKIRQTVQRYTDRTARATYRLRAS